MQNNERFQNLPPGRQQQIRQNLQKWNNLTPDQKNALRERAQRWQQLSREDRQKVRNELLPKWQEMTPERRQAVNGKLHTLQGMSAADREKALNDPKFMQGLNPDDSRWCRASAGYVVPQRYSSRILRRNFLLTLTIHFWLFLSIGQLGVR